jgi:DNA-binding MarR family transcriptional regulator
MRKQILENSSIGQLEHLHRYYHWARDRVLRRHGLRHVHLTMLRAVGLQESISLHEIRQITGYSRSAMNKHRDSLVDHKLICELPREGDRRMVRLGSTERGKLKLDEIDRAIEAEFRKMVGLTPSQLRSFAKKLADALDDFPVDKTFDRVAYRTAKERKAAADRQAALEQRSVVLEPSAKSPAIGGDDDIPW